MLDKRKFLINAISPIVFAFIFGVVLLFITNTSGAWWLFGFVFAFLTALGEIIWYILKVIKNMV